MERDMEKDLIEIECAAKGQAKRDNMFTLSVLQRCYKLVSELKEYKDLEEQGKLLKLPCAVGDTVYVISDDCDYGFGECYTKMSCENCEYRNLHIKEEIFSLSQIALHMNAFGKTIFLTKEAAEAALKEL